MSKIGITLFLPESEPVAPFEACPGNQNEKCTD